MFRKILLSLLILVLLIFGGLFALLATNSDIIIDRFQSYVENSTGAPLVSDTRPEFTLLPNRGLELGASSWEKPDGSLSISFSRASVLISSHALFSGRFSIKNFTVDDLALTVRLQRPLREYLARIPERLEHRRELDDVVESILHGLYIAPDAISVTRGRICFIEPDGRRITLEPFTLNVSDVHPGDSTNFKLSTGISSSAPAFKAGLELSCTALFTKNDAAFAVKNASFTPQEGFSFPEDITFSGAVHYDYGKSTVSLTGLKLSGPAIAAEASGSIASLAQLYLMPKLGDATLKLDIKGDPQRLASILKSPLPFLDHKSFSDCALNAELHWAQGRLEINAMQGRADSVTFGGHLTVLPSPYTMSGDLRFGDVSLESYRADSSGSHMKNLDPRDFTRWPKVDLHLSAEHLRWDRLHLEGVHTRMTGHNGTYELNPFTGILAGSPVTASFKSVMLPTSPLSARISLNLSIPQARLEDISSLLLQETVLTGTGAVNAALSLTSSRGLASLSGSGSISSSNIRTNFSVLPPSTPFSSLITASNKFDRLLLSFKAKEGLVYVNKFTLSAPRLALSGSGRLDLPNKNIDASGTIRIAGSTVLPVLLNGSIRDPRYSLDMRSGKDKEASIDITLDLDLPRQIEKIIGAPR
ncbi:hypothetical protein [Mailhella sp.]|uniref:hypothetical protein n=1 Tax=Mailhella sp. TaxID=1981029 RepID=UPI004063AE2C